jgi:hypothetical protein
MRWFNESGNAIVPHGLRTDKFGGIAVADEALRQFLRVAVQMLRIRQCGAVAGWMAGATN